MSLKNCINYLFTVAQHEIFQTFSEGLAPFNITPGQYGVLRCLWEDGPCTPKELAQTLRLETSTISGVLDRMEKKGLVERVIDKKDRRSVRVMATREGLAMQEDVLRVIDQLNEQVLCNFEPESRETLLDCLRQIGKVE